VKQKQAEREVVCIGIIPQRLIVVWSLTQAPRLIGAGPKKPSQCCATNSSESKKAIVKAAGNAAGK